MINPFWGAHSWLRTESDGGGIEMQLNYVQLGVGTLIQFTVQIRRDKKINLFTKWTNKEK